jgi:pyruvate dehydrogenase E2 component (dihydrolipoamide acetyltransferase)
VADTGPLDIDRVGHRVTRADVEAAARSRISPRARRIARGAGLEPADLVGTGPRGSVVARDVERAAAADEAGGAPALSRVTDASSTSQSSAGGRGAMVRSMERSNREIPHYHLASAVDLEPALGWLEELNADRPPSERILPAALLVRATALAARAVPEVNGWWKDAALVPAPSVAVGMVVSLRGGGLVTPSLPGADEGSLDDLMKRMRSAVDRARRGSLLSSDMETASITVTNLGDRGAELVHGVIQPPQVALVGFGRIDRRPWVVEDSIVARRVVHVSLAADHRASDGHIGSRFLNLLARRLAEPQSLRGEDDGT